MNRLTETKIQALLKESVNLEPGHSKIVAANDGSGLCIRITNSGASWLLRYRHAGKPHSLALGKYPECNFTEARKRATRERARIVDGVNPVAERRRSKLAIRAAKSFRELAADYETRAMPDLKESTQKAYRLLLIKDILPRLGDLKIKDITGAEIVQMVEQVGKRSDSTARHCFKVTSIIFSHGIAKQIASANPCANLKVRAILGKAKPVRAPVSLTEDQLREVMASLHVIERRSALAVKIILATCVRKGEIRNSKWTWLDLDNGTWTIPGAFSKNGKSFTIPLAPVVVGWFIELKELALGSEWVLPGMVRGKPISANTLNNAIDRLPRSQHFTVHDLRRTARTHLGRLGADIITAEKCLNHTLGGLVDVYDRGDYLEERRRALQIWADFLVRCESPAENVVSLRRA